ncbi:hypothetical protein ACIQTZ_21990 [Paenarthrobacter sp. NPDC090520]|uniref:hypothetical protein n=1 Tax=Paenarthrobacter sp. NPDC090520 TaxID=3364382 RepID=UPI0038103E2F
MSGTPANSEDPERQTPRPASEVPVEEPDDPSLSELISAEDPLGPDAEEDFAEYDSSGTDPASPGSATVDPDGDDGAGRDDETTG